MGTTSYSIEIDEENKPLILRSPVSCVLSHPKGKLRRSVPLHVLSQART